MESAQWQQVKNLFHAALDLSEDKRTAFLAEACDGDGALRCEVEALLKAHEQAGGFIVEPAFVEAGIILDEEQETSFAGKRIGSYEVLKELGCGGMGAVYLAVRSDDEYHKEVAIKLIKRGMDTDAILKRFRTERQILAQLEHTNIARLLDGGTTDDGLPYFVMEYVKGKPITKYCDHHNLNTTERLKLFREVCSAVQYSHQNLVVHRDLKPSNILVTEDATPKLLDFGIAKLLNPNWSSDATEQTASMMLMMTPEYASPEQIRGLAITTASDVYSLGVVLYELLSGCRPFKVSSRTPEEVVQAILTEEPLRPSAVVSSQQSAVNEKMMEAETLRRQAAETVRDGFSNATGKEYKQKTNSKFKIQSSKSKIQNLKSLRGDLDNIILKALRKETERRYATVQEFAEDIRRHLEGLPVKARADTFRYRASKFIQRHKAGVAAAVIVVVMLLAATAITTWQARVARRERAKAEQRFNDVRQLANSVVFEFHDSIQDLPGSTPSRELLVSRALEYLDKLASEAEKERSLQLELAAAYDKIGDIQGGFSTSHLGQRQKAVVSYRKALAIREALVAAEPANVDFRRKLSTSYTKLGHMLWVETDLAGSLEFHRKALVINQELAAAAPLDAETRFDLASSYTNFGYMQGASGRFNEALENTRKGVVLLEELAAADPNNDKIQRRLALSYDRVAEILSELTQNYSEALILIRKSQKISEKLLIADPLNTTLRRDQAVSYFLIAEISAKLGDIKTALDSSRKSLSIFTELSSADPQNEEFRQIVATAQTFVCEMMIKNGDAAEAIELLDQSLLTLEKSFAASPTDETAHFRIAKVQAGLGKGYVALASDGRTSAQRRLAHWHEARSWLQKSLEIYKAFRAAGKITGEEAAKVDDITEEIAKCDAAIARLTGK